VSGDLIFADRKYRRMGGVWMMQPNTLMRGFIAVAEESTIAMLDEIERLRAEVERLQDENATLRRNEWRLIWGLCTECGANRDKEARRG
jgi:hypothetical protein